MFLYPIEVKFNLAAFGVAMATNSEVISTLYFDWFSLNVLGQHQ